MKKLSALMYAFIAATLFLASCGGDDETDPLAPTITATTAAPGSAAPGSSFTVAVNVLQGDAKLSSVSLREDGQPLLATRYTINGETPKSIEKYDINENKALTFVITAGTKAGKYLYSISVEDKDGLSNKYEFSVSVAENTENSNVKIYSNESNATDAGTIGSFYSTTKNQTFATAAAATNLESLDFAVYESTGALVAVEARASAVANTFSLVRPQDQKTSNTTVTSSTTAQTVFSTTSLNFDSVKFSELEAATATATSVAISSGSTYFYYNSATKVRALIKINSIGTSTVNFSVKYIVK